MKNNTILLFFSTLLVASPCYAAPPDLFGDYNRAINSQAEARTNELHSAWGENMAHNITNKRKNGIVVTGPADNELYHSDGLGNVTIKKGANVGTVINKTEANNSTIIIQQNQNKRY